MAEPSLSEQGAVRDLPTVLGVPGGASVLEFSSVVEEVWPSGVVEEVWPSNVVEEVWP